ncbi:MAG: DUF349 domain-containing protein [Candidatus Competibacteraceae bacterium]
MILSRFLKPKWQHHDPEARKQSLQELESTDPKLIALAQHDAEPAIRRAALERLSDLDLLQRIADEDTDAEVRAAAQDRYRALLTGKLANGPTLAARLERLQRQPDTRLAEFLLLNAAEPELRLAALERISPDLSLAEIVLRNSHPDVRLAALERVDDPTLLEQIARQSRNRDKRLYRRARERLDTLAATRARATHLERLCAEIENLHWDGESGLNAGRFPKLDQEWRELAPTALSELQTRYEQARSRFLADRQASAARRTQRLELCATLEALLERLQHELEPNAEINAAIQYATCEAPVAWAHFGSAQDSEGRRQEQRFQQLVQNIHEQERILHRNQIRAERLREILSRAETLLQQSSEVHETDLKNLKHRWDGLERPESHSFASDLQTRFDGLLDKLRARLQRQVQQRDQEWQELQTLVSQLETTLENGELQQATHLHEQSRQRLKHNIGLSRAQMASVEERLQTCATRIGELCGWRRWGTNQAREQLCETAETLIDLDADPIYIAQRIQEVREAWKELDHHEGTAPKVLWKRFNSACERAYAPCQVYFKAQAHERQENFQKKQAICEHLERFEATTEWNQVDWREADRLRRRTQEQWYKLGPVNRADRKSLDRRFHQALQRLDAHLDAERDREIHRRQNIIQQVQALVDHPDLRAAIETAKEAQAEWHPTVQAVPRQEQALWKDFRAACDAVFARRQAEQQAADSERHDNLKHKLMLCEESEALAQIDNDQLVQARARMQAIQHEWDNIGPIPKTEYKAVTQRFETAIRQFANHERTLRRANVRETFQHLQHRARLCARLEALLATPTTDPTASLAQAQQEWSNLPALAAALAEPMQQRFSTICQALTTDSATLQLLRARLAENLERKQVWCVCMEIVAGVESPPEFAQLRMEYQVARLSASLAGAAAKGDALYDPRQLQEQWCLTGALPAEAEIALDRRFLEAVQIWWQREEI